MSTWPNDAETLIRQYVETLPLRSPSSQAAARSHLRRFQQFVVTHASPTPLSCSTLQVWLRDLQTRVSLRSVIESARRVEGFLAWLVGEGILPGTPWTPLRATYGHRIAPIVRAFLEPNPRDALDALRPLPRFGSHLGPAMRQHLAIDTASASATNGNKSGCSTLIAISNADPRPTNSPYTSWFENMRRVPRRLKRDSSGGRAAAHSPRACTATIPPSRFPLLTA